MNASDQGRLWGRGITYLIFVLTFAGGRSPKLTPKRVLLTLLVVFSLAQVLCVNQRPVFAGPQSPPSAPVTVVNPASSPVPVAPQGTTTVTGSVTITGTTQSDPVPVRTIVKEIFQSTFSSDSWTNSSVSDTSFKTFSSWGIPTGKFLVLEGVSAQVKVNPGEKVVMSVTCQGVAGFGEHHPVLTSQGSFDEAGPNVDILVTSAPVRCYAAGSSGLLISFLRNSRVDVAGGSLIHITEASISGYLQDVPE